MPLVEALSVGVPAVVEGVWCSGLGSVESIRLASAAWYMTLQLWQCVRAGCRALAVTLPACCSTAGALMSCLSAHSTSRQAFMQFEYCAKLCGTCCEV